MPAFDVGMIVGAGFGIAAGILLAWYVLRRFWHLWGPEWLKVWMPHDRAAPLSPAPNISNVGGRSYRYDSLGMRRQDTSGSSPCSTDEHKWMHTGGTDEMQSSLV